MKKVLLTVALAGLIGATAFAQDSTHVRHKATTAHTYQKHKTQQHKMMKKTKAHKAQSADSSHRGK